MVSAEATAKHRNPPGPSEPFDSADNLFRWMNENFFRYGEIYSASVFGSRVYVVSAPEYCERILRWNWRNYPRAGLVVKRISWLLGNGLIASNGEFWASQRRMIQPAFSKSSISELTAVISSVNGELLQKWKHAARNEQMINVTRDVSFMVLKLVLVAIFGDDFDNTARHFDFLAHDVARNLEFAQVFRQASKIILETAAKRRRDGVIKTDFLGKLMQARDRDRGEPMPDAQLAMEVMTIIVAGHETTASVINWMWYLLARHPNLRTTLCEEFDRVPWQEIPAVEALSKYTYTRRIIDETLRLYPPLWLMTRKAREDDYLGDFFVPAGTEIYISPYIIQRNPELWEAPDEFDPDRMDPDHALDHHELAFCPFGAGPRNCIGELFARVEIQIHLMMFARELWLRHEQSKSPEISTEVNLLSKHDFIMMPEINPLH